MIKRICCLILLFCSFAYSSSEKQEFLSGMATDQSSVSNDDENLIARPKKPPLPQNPSLVSESRGFVVSDDESEEEEEWEEESEETSEYSSDSQNERLRTENQRLRAELRRKENYISCLQMEIINFRRARLVDKANTRMLSAANDQLLAENHQLRAEIEQLCAKNELFRRMLATYEGEPVTFAPASYQSSLSSQSSFNLLALAPTPPLRSIPFSPASAGSSVSPPAICRTFQPSVLAQPCHASHVQQTGDSSLQVPLSLPSLVETPGTSYGNLGGGYSDVMSRSFVHSSSSYLSNLPLPPPPSSSSSMSGSFVSSSTTPLSNIQHLPPPPSVSSDSAFVVPSKRSPK